MIKKIIPVLLMIVSLSNQLTAQNKSEVIKMKNLKQTDIGNPAIAGTVTITDKEIDINAGGSDIWGIHDEFHFSYKSIKGDFDLCVQVLSLSAANKYTKAGIMARADLSDNSQHVYYQVFPDNSSRNKNNGGCEFQYRSVKAGEMKAIYPDMKTAGNQFDVTFPDTWIRLKRHGNVFESYMSSDLKTWKRYSTFEQILPDELFVGLAVTSHNPSGITTAKFESFRFLK
jgi:regulation of enolase protein 1 (concanavalin A-like superfamily)